MKDPRFIFAFSDLRWVVFELEFELTSLGSVFLRAFTSQGPIPSGLGARAYPASHTETRPFVRRRPRRPDPGTLLADGLAAAALLAA